jgi:hypothetical protein
MKIIIFLLIYLLNFAYLLLAQSKDRQVFASRGNTAIVGGYEIDYTLGEVVVNTFETSQVLLTQGFIQPMDFPALSISPFHSKTRLPIYTIYPNPTHKTLFIKLTSTEYLEFQLELLTLEGKQIQPLFVGRISKEEKEIKEIEVALPDLAPDVYLLCASFNNNQRLAYKEYHKIIVY